MTGTQAEGHRAEPNVWVAHLRDGIEAVGLHTGRTICKLHLASPGLHVDLNGDGVLDHLQATGKLLQLSRDRRSIWTENIYYKRRFMQLFAMPPNT